MEKILYAVLGFSVRNENNRGGKRLLGCVNDGFYTTSELNLGSVCFTENNLQENVFSIFRFLFRGK